MPGPHQPEAAQHRWRHQVTQPIERGFQHGTKRRQFLPVIGHEAGQGGCIRRRQSRDLLLHPRQIGRRAHMAARLEQ
jgi:hypothetical protein